MKLNEYLKTTKTNEFAGGSGLPEGKTTFNIEKTDIQEITGLDGKPRWQLTQDNKTFVVPKAVM